MRGAPYIIAKSLRCFMCNGARESWKGCFLYSDVYQAWYIENKEEDLLPKVVTRDAHGHHIVVEINMRIHR